MLTVRNISVATEQYGDAYESVVTFQVGDHNYNTVKIKLTPDQTREVVESIVSKATTLLTVVPSDIRIAGEVPPVADLAPEFAEVDEPAPIAIPPAPYSPEEAF